MSITPSLEVARALALDLCARRKVTLVTPDAAPVLRLAVHASIALASPLTLAEVRERVSVYVPQLVADLVSLLPDEVAVPLDLDAPLILLSPRAWGDPLTLLGVIAHELGHHARDLAVRARAPELPLAGIVASSLWALAYLVHPRVRVWEESTCYLADLVIAVVVGGADPRAAADSALTAIRGSYRPGDAMDAAESTLDSAVASLRRQQLPGVGTPVHELLRALVAGGWDPGPWRGAIEARAS